ncbi:MAG: caspase family protein, partial [Nitrososphaeria archaeon]|nr:caspase family protein [Nitrososphaeria archaeon]
ATYVQPGYNFDDWPNGCYDVTPEESDVISPGETDFVHLYFDVPNDAPIGKYDVRIAVWDKYDEGRNKLEGKFNQIDLLNIFEIWDFTVHKNAVLFASSDYISATDLPGAKNSMCNIKNLLQFGFRFDCIIDYNNPDITTIHNALKYLEENTDSNDIKFVYYAGHGSKNLEKGGPEEISLYDNTGITDDLLNLWFERLTNMTGIFDCCYSGGLCHFTDDDSDPPAENPKYYPYNGIVGDSKIILMSTKSTQTGTHISPNYPHGGGEYMLFTNCFIEAFTTGREKAANLIFGDANRVSVEEAFIYAKEKVEKEYWYLFSNPQIYDAWPTQNDNREQFYLSDEPINNYWSIQSHSPVHLHAYDDQGRHVGLNEDGEIDREIPGVYYSGPWVENETIIVFNPENYSNIRIVGEAYDDGNFTLENKKYTKENQTIITTMYETIFVENGSILTVDVENGEFGDMKVDEDGDGDIDKEIQAYAIPVANFVYSTEDNQTITFNASSSFDPDGEIISYHWNFGDGNTATGKIVKHTYKKSGN